MTNKTELPDLDRLEALARGLSDIRDQIMQDRVVSVVDVEDLIDRLALARRAQPEGEAPQAEPFGYFIVEGDDLPYPGAGFVRQLAEGRKYASVTPLYERTAPAAQHAESGAPAPDAARVDAIVTGLYRRFKEWSKRGFGPDDVTWCEVKADVIELIASGGAVLAAQSQGAPALPTARAGDPDVDAAQWAEVFYRNAETFTVRDLGIVRAAWKEATRRAAQLDGSQGEGKAHA